MARLIRIPTKSARALIPLAGWGVLIAGVRVAKPQQPSAGKTPDVTSESVEPLPGDWAPELLYAILSSANPDASDALYRAAFSAGPAIAPQLEGALKDDRTAEFAAQSLAFIGGPKAMDILAGLVNDPRDLNLRRFFYGALGEFNSPQATGILLNAIARSNSEPDRTVSEAAILALTVRSDPNLLSELKKEEGQIKDVVIHDDLDNAVAVIESRSKYLASEEGKKSDGSIDAAVRTYFIPALEPPPEAASTAPGHAALRQDHSSTSLTVPERNRREDNDPSLPRRQSEEVKTERSRTAARNGEAREPVTGKPAPRAKPPVSVEVWNLTFSPDQSRALARVIFEDPSAVANYDIVLQKQAGNWTVVSVWLGSETPKPVAPPGP